MYRTPFACGVAAFVLMALGPHLAPVAVASGAWQLLWLGAVCGTAALLSHRDTLLGWRSGAVILAAHVPCVLIAVLAQGEPRGPGRSSAAADLAIVMAMLVFLSPLPLLAGHLAARRRRVRAAATGNGPVAARAGCYARGDRVRIRARAELDAVAGSWRGHHAMQASQMVFADTTATVCSVDCYRDTLLYRLDYVPGVWPAASLVAAGDADAVTAIASCGVQRAEGAGNSGSGGS